MKFMKILFATITRMSIYSRALEAMVEEGVQSSPASCLADVCSINPAQIRKNLELLLG